MALRGSPSKSLTVYSLHWRELVRELQCPLFRGTKPWLLPMISHQVPLPLLLPHI